MESEDELASLSANARVPRALTLIALSILAISFAGIAYLHPGIGFGAAPNVASSPGDALPATRLLVAVDFVTPNDGWVVVESQPHTFALMRTADGGDSWTRQFGGPEGSNGEYMRFFDRYNGALVTLGSEPMLYQTDSGGFGWSADPLAQYGESILSADFVDTRHGWLLAEDAKLREKLLRTDDGGQTWTGLGNPVLATDWAYRIAFANRRIGWLYSRSAGPYAYKSVDAGTTWRRVPLPAPPAGWAVASASSLKSGMASEQFFVASHPTEGAGVMATVIGVAPPAGRSPHGGVVLGYPPLTVQTYDSGGSVTYVYADVSPYRYSSIEYVNPGQLVDVEPNSQFQLSSVDGGLSWKSILTPSTFGSVGFVDAVHWWWIGSGAKSTSSDAGETWTRVRTMAVPEPLPGSLQFIDAAHAWFGAMAGTRPLVEATDDGGVNWRMVLLPATPPA